MGAKLYEQMCENYLFRTFEWNCRRALVKQHTLEVYIHTDVGTFWQTMGDLLFYAEGGHRSTNGG